MRRLIVVATVAVLTLFVAPPTFAQAAGPCFDNTNRYVNCGNGTVTDTVTGLIWLQQSDCLPDLHYTFAEANQAAAAVADGTCGLTDGSVPGDWRLPAKAEWTATVARAVALGCTAGMSPSLTNDPGTGCLSAGPSSFTGVASFLYWSSSSNETNPVSAWFANLFVGNVFGGFGKASTLRVWPVRGGPR